MATIQTASKAPWRLSLVPAMFRDARFHVDTGVKESGRRIVVHEFPKRDIPYAEDMGRRAREFTVRGYIIAYPAERDSNPLHKKNYLPARDKLIEALEQEGPAELQLPLLGKLKVAAQRYRVTEENRLGGFCVFDMTFVEYGKAPAEGTRDSASGVSSSASTLGAAVTAGLFDGIRTLPSGTTAEVLEGGGSSGP